MLSFYEIKNKIKFSNLIEYVANNDSQSDARYDSVGPVAEEYFYLFQTYFSIKYFGETAKLREDGIKNTLKWLMWKIFIAVLYSILHPEDPKSYKPEQLSRIVSFVSQWNMNHMFPSPEPSITIEDVDIYSNYRNILHLLFPAEQHTENAPLSVGASYIIRLQSSDPATKLQGELPFIIEQYQKHTQFIHHHIPPPNLQGGKRRQTRYRKKTKASKRNTRKI